MQKQAVADSFKNPLNLQKSPQKPFAALISNVLCQHNRLLSSPECWRHGDE